MNPSTAPAHPQFNKSIQSHSLRMDEIDWFWMRRAMAPQENASTKNEWNEWFVDVFLAENKRRQSILFHQLFHFSLKEMKCWMKLKIDLANGGPLPKENKQIHFQLNLICFCGPARAALPIQINLFFSFQFLQLLKKWRKESWLICWQQPPAFIKR